MEEFSKMAWICAFLLLYSVFISFKYLSCDVAPLPINTNNNNNSLTIDTLFVDDDNTPTNK